MTQMTEAKVKDILRNHDGILRGIRKKIFQLYMEMENNTGVESLVLSSKGSNEAGICLNKKGGNSKGFSRFHIKGRNCSPPSESGACQDDVEADRGRAGH